MLQKRPGPLTLNGPIVEGFSCKVILDDIEVLITANTREHAEGVAAYLLANGLKLAPASHTLTGQPPWYENKTQENTLDDALERTETWPYVKRKRGSLL